MEQFYVRIRAYCKIRTIFPGLKAFAKENVRAWFPIVESFVTIGDRAIYCGKDAKKNKQVEIEGLFLKSGYHVAIPLFYRCLLSL